MNNPQQLFPTYDATRAQLNPVIRVTRQALVHGLSEARGLFVQRGEDVELSLFGHYARYDARMFLARRGSQAEYEEEADSDKVAGQAEYTPQQLANSGLCLTSGPFKVRIWRAEGGGRIPDPGSSKQKRQFLRQAEQLPLVIDESEVEIKTNIIMLWEIDSQRFELGRMWLACPRSYSARTKRIGVHWHEEITNPMVPDDLAQRARPSASARRSTREIPLQVKAGHPTPRP